MKISCPQTKLIETGAPSLRHGHRGEDLPSQLHLCRHYGCNRHEGSPFLPQDLEVVLGSQSQSYYLNIVRNIDQRRKCL